MCRPPAAEPREFPLGDFSLLNGELLKNGKLSYVTYGDLRVARDGSSNAVLFPTHYGGTHHDNAQWIGFDRALNPEQYFIIIPNMFGNGFSSSPSNSSEQPGPDFPHIDTFDNARAQQRLLSAQFGIDRLQLAFGWSMGAQQILHLAALYPSCSKALLAVCGTAQTSEHNRMFLAGLKAALTADASYAGGKYTTPPERGLRAFARVYASWAYSQAFFRNGLYRQLGFKSPEQLLTAWEEEHLAWDANDLLCLLTTWQRTNLAAHPNFNNSLSAALGAVQAYSVLMPSETDLYFHHEDVRREALYLTNGHYQPLKSSWGHAAGAPNRSPDDSAEIERVLRQLLEHPGTALAK